MSAKKKSTYEIVTSAMLDALDNGTVPWHKPWREENGGKPLSMSTKKPYRGFNSLALSATSFDEGYSSPWWGTFKKINSLGGRVIKDQHPTPVSVYNFVKKKNKDGEEEVTAIFHRYYRVFNQEQTTGLDDVFPKPEVVDVEFTPVEQAEKLITLYTTAPKVIHKGSKAYYSPTKDIVGMPRKESFDTPGDYYSALFHEYVHSTGHKDRLNRDLEGLFGSHSYSYEELVAEMGSAFLSYDAGLEATLDNSASYLASWLKQLKENPSWIVKAGNKAQQAVDYMTGHTYDRETGEKDNER
jgi:antirestriction protein ArdC